MPRTRRFTVLSLPFEQLADRIFIAPSDCGQKLRVNLDQSDSRSFISLIGGCAVIVLVLLQTRVFRGSHIVKPAECLLE